MSMLRDIFRRRFRALLTISGISVGVLSLVVMGAFAEKATLSVANIDTVLDNLVLVNEGNETSMMGGLDAENPLPPDTLARLEQVPGVLGVSPGIPMMLDADAPVTGVPSTIMGSSVDQPELAKRMRYLKGEGRVRFRSGDRGVAIVGSDLVKQLGAKIGGTITVRDREFEVIGILDRTLLQTADQQVTIPLDDAREIYAESIPEAFRPRVDVSKVVVQAAVVTEDGVDADDLAMRIEREVDGVMTFGPGKIRTQTAQLVTLIRLVTVAVGAVALLVGALSVVNTMLVAVVERTHEIGVKRALGASTWRVAADVIGESSLMSVLGGLVGLAGGALLTFAINRVTYNVNGSASFSLTPRIALAAILFAAILGMMGGAYPARYASRLDPVDALVHD